MSSFAEMILHYYVTLEHIQSSICSVLAFGCGQIRATAQRKANKRFCNFERKVKELGWSNGDDSLQSTPSSSSSFSLAFTIQLSVRFTFQWTKITAHSLIVSSYLMKYEWLSAQHSPLTIYLSVRCVCVCRWRIRMPASFWHTVMHCHSIHTYQWLAYHIDMSQIASIHDANAQNWVVPGIV